MQRRRLVFLLTIVTGLWAVIVWQAVGVIQATWPQLAALAQRTFGTVEAVCGCVGYVEPVHQSSLWLGGGLIALALWMLAYAVWRVYRIQRATTQLKQEVVEQAISTTTMQGIQIIQVEDAKPFAITLGWFFPRVYVSTGLMQTLQSFELLAVLQHEISHARFRDPLIRSVLLAIVPLATIRTWVHAHVLAWQEVAADEAAQAGDVQSAFIALVEKSQPMPMPELAVTNGFSGSHDMRMEYWLNRRLPWNMWLSLAVGSVVIAIVLAWAQQVAAVNVPSEIVRSCFELQAMCEEVMSRLPMSRPF